VKTLQKECNYLVVLGIGGSALGNIALDTALRPFLPDPKDKQSGRPQLFVFDNVDPDQFGSFLDYIKPQLKRTVFNVISKSGRTSETAAQFMIVREMLIDALGKAGYQKQVVATTDARAGTLRTIADIDKLETLEVPDGVGGRFSVLSAVGLFSAAMCGINLNQLLAGARDMDARVKTARFLENPAAINAAINYHYYTHGKPISVMMPYSYALKDMADWYRQLWAESLGKKLDLDKREVWIGPTPIKALGTTDQHSQVQLYREGSNDKLFTFLQVNNFAKSLKIGPAPDCSPELGFLAGKKMSTLFNNEKKATEYALMESNRPNLTVIFDKVNAYTVGQFIYLYEVTTSFMGALLDINPYDQPAVELGKEATFALMGKEGYEDFALEIQSKTEIDEDFLV
jgi:glucose-6-phosphate isomerase